MEEYEKLILLVEEVAKENSIEVSVNKSRYWSVPCGLRSKLSGVVNFVKQYADKKYRCDTKNLNITFNLNQMKVIASANGITVSTTAKKPRQCKDFFDKIKVKIVPTLLENKKREVTSKMAMDIANDDLTPLILEDLYFEFKEEELELQKIIEVVKKKKERLKSLKEKMTDKVAKNANVDRSFFDGLDTIVFNNCKNFYGDGNE